MKRITRGVLALGMLWIGCSCSTAMPGAETETSRAFGFTHFGQAFADTDQDGLPDARLGTVAKLDDVTNNAGSSGWQARLGDGDVRGRTENFFEDTVAPEPEPEAPESERKMVYTAAFGVMVPAVDEAVQKLLARVQTLGGYLSKRQNAKLTVRVPADKFQTLVSEVPEFGRVVSESLNANDVTSQHTDLTIRLENAEKSRQRLLALLEKATKMEDVIKIEEALRRLTGEIEGMKGQLKLLNDQIAFSTVTVAFQANAPAAKAKSRRRASRFPWINRIGIEQDLRRF